MNFECKNVKFSFLKNYNIQQIMKIKLERKMKAFFLTALATILNKYATTLLNVFGTPTLGRADLHKNSFIIFYEIMLANLE